MHNLYTQYIVEASRTLITQYAMVRNVSAISPVNMVEKNRFMSSRFLGLANDLHSFKFVTSSIADNAKFQYDEFVKKEAPKK